MTAYSPIPESGMLSIQLPLGNHRLSLYHPNYVFEDLRVHRKSFNEVKTYLQPFDVHGSMRGPFLSGNENVSWIALKKKVYHEVHQGFQFFSLFRSPMMLMAIFSLLMVYVMPKLASHIEQESQANGNGDLQIHVQKNELVKLFEELQ
ncbi:hypothetical protein HMI55_002858 [Coelomomyces lativittatus]|nr:hypothetical protein HMI55_002858 [Coelomomyces lativittatus]